MSAAIRGFQAQEVKSQPGFRPRRTENGTWTGSHQFTIKRSDWANSAVRNRFAKGTAITDLDESLDGMWSFLKIVEQEPLHDEGDLIVIGVSLAGGQFAQYGGEDLGADAEATYRLNGYLQEKPFEEHPKWKELSDDQKAALGHCITGALVYDEDKGEVCKINPSAASADEFFDPFLPYEGIITGDALEFAKRIAQGKTTYLCPVLTWTESTQGTDQLTPAQINALGKISNPRGTPPEPTGGRDWQLTSAQQDQRGDVFSTNIEWTLSERGGHDDFLYST